MSQFLLCMTAAVTLSLGGQALARQAARTPSSPPATAQTPPVNPPANTALPSASPPASSPAASADASSSPASATAPANLTVGLTVKDNTGATIGQIADLKADAGGKQMATIKMGTDTFTVAASSLAVQDGAATINLTQQQIKGMIRKPG
jgi:hypothetical protein